jgi:trimeric autotransporter adhesin
MKKLMTLLLIFFSVSAYSQNNITNTIGTNGNFVIKDASTNYLVLTQATGDVYIRKTLSLENTTSSTSGVIYKNTYKFLHNYQASGTDGVNTFLGMNAGNFTMSGSGIEASYNTGIGVNTLFSLTNGNSNVAMGVNSLYYNSSGTNNTGIGNSSLFNNSTGNYNTAIGSSSLISNTTGFSNSALGFRSLYSNTTGIWNTAVGDSALYRNTIGSYNTASGYQSLLTNTSGYLNTALGYQSLLSNTTGHENTAVGSQSLFANTTGFNNTALGTQSLLSNTTGQENTAVGSQSLQLNTTGNSNTALGNQSLYKNTTGHENTAVGYYSLYFNTTGFLNTALGEQSLTSNTTGYNNTAIGYNAQVPDGTSNNQVRIGNTFVTYAGVQVAWTITSDRRWKSDIQNSNLGLGFISKLNPVSYYRTNDENKKTEYGFIAQEVEEVLKESGIDNSGMLTITDEGMYELRYNDLLAPMVKAIQELKAEKDELKTENTELKDRLLKLEQMQNMLALEIKNMKSKDENLLQVQNNK